MQDFINYCKDYILDHIDDYEGQLVDMSDLGWTITDGPNCDGSLTYNRWEAINYLRELWDECADYYEHEKPCYGETTNPFENPEAYMVCMVIEGVRTIMEDAIGSCEFDQDAQELTPEIIAHIKDSVRDYDGDRLF